MPVPGKVCVRIVWYSQVLLRIKAHDDLCRILQFLAVSAFSKMPAELSVQHVRQSVYLQGLTRPCGRSGHGMTLAMQGDRTVMLVHGGRSKGDVLHNDTWLLELPAMEVAV